MTLAAVRGAMYHGTSSHSFGRVALICIGLCGYMIERGNVESLPVFGNRYVPSFFQHVCLSTRLTENIVGEKEMVELIYTAKEDLKRCLA